MANEIDQRKKAIRDLVVLAVVVAAAVLVPYVFTVSEPGKICVLGVALVGVAVWARKRLKAQADQ
jgi:hypothetical protein